MQPFLLRKHDWGMIRYGYGLSRIQLLAMSYYLLQWYHIPLLWCHDQSRFFSVYCNCSFRFPCRRHWRRWRTWCSWSFFYLLEWSCVHNCHGFCVIAVNTGTASLELRWFFTWMILDVAGNWVLVYFDWMTVFVSALCKWPPMVYKEGLLPESTVIGSYLAAVQKAAQVALW